MYTRDVKVSFPNNNIKKFTLWIFTHYVTVLTSFQENDPCVFVCVCMIRGVIPDWLSGHYKFLDSFSHLKVSTSILYGHLTSCFFRLWICIPRLVQSLNILSYNKNLTSVSFLFWNYDWLNCAAIENSITVLFSPLSFKLVYRSV